MPYPFYGVRRGRKTGVFTTWAETQEQVSGYPSPLFRGFNTRKEAQDFVGSPPQPPGPATPFPTSRPHWKVYVERTDGSLLPVKVNSDQAALLRQAGLPL